MPKPVVPGPRPANMPAPRRPAPPVYRPAPAVQAKPAPPVFRPPMGGARGAPPVYRPVVPAARPLQMKPIAVRPGFRGGVIQAQLAAQLTALLEGARDNKQEISQAQWGALVAGAAPMDRQAAAADDELLYFAQRWVSDFHHFVQALGVAHQATVQPLDQNTVDQAIRTELQPHLVVPLSRNVTIVNRVHVYSADVFKGVRRMLDPSMAVARTPVNAFTEEGCIFLLSTNPDNTTIIHEGIHLYADGVVKRTFGGYFDEGVTEYFARKVATNQFHVARNKYAAEVAGATPIVNALTENLVAGAYFGGDIARLKARFVSLRTGKHSADPEADWSQFQEHCKAHELDKALALVA